MRADGAVQAKKGRVRAALSGRECGVCGDWVYGERGALRRLQLIASCDLGRQDAVRRES